MRSCIAAAADWLFIAFLGLAAFSPQASAQDLTIKSTHTGAFLLGQTNAYYLIWVRNAGSAPTSGLVSVTENAPAGLTITSMSGFGWTCTANSCGSTDPLAAGASYPAIIVLATVAGSAPASVTNQVTVSGGGDRNAANNTATDVTAIAARGWLASWGEDTYGRTGGPDYPPPNLVAVAPGVDHTLALKSDGTVVGWGMNDPLIRQAQAPTGLANVIAVAAGDQYSLALRSNGTLAFWGFAGYDDYAPPDGLSGVVAIATNGYRSMVLTNVGTVQVWAGPDTPMAAFPAGLAGVVAIAMGRYNCLALKSDGTVVSWGETGYGQEIVPAGLSNVVAIAAGGFHSMALKSDGTVVSWGIDMAGETIVPPGLSNVVAIAAGYAHSLALKSDGTVVAWGDGGGAGAGAVPPGLSDVVAVAAGQDNSFVLVGSTPATMKVAARVSAPNTPLTVDGTTYNYASMAFQWMPGASHTIGTESLHHGGLGEQYVFKRWSDGGAITHAVAPVYASNYLASFDHQYQITTLANPPAGGAISPATGFFTEGTAIQVTATPNPGYPFTGFSGGLTGTANPQNLTISAVQTVTANFTAITPPTAPSLTSPADGASGVPVWTRLNWAPVVGADSYDVYFGTSPSPELNGNTAETTYNPSAMVNNETRYYWKVVAKNGGGSVSSPVWSFTTESAAPPPWSPPPTDNVCVIAVTPSTSTVAGVGDDVTLSVRTASACIWTLPVLPAWITTSASLAYTGPQTVTLSVASNSGSPRSVNLDFGGVAVTINQAAPCTCTLGSAGQGMLAAGGAGTIQVRAAPDCVWLLSQPPSWVTYTGTAGGAGNADVAYRVAANAGTRRNATVTAGGAAFFIDQNGAVAISAGTMAHFASGGDWTTRFTLLNTGYGTAHARLTFFDDNGNPVQATAAERNGAPRAAASAVSAATGVTDLGSALNPGAVLRIDAPANSVSGATESTGWARLLTDGTVSGYGVFLLNTPAGIQEAVVPPETRNVTSYYLPFDNTGGYYYGVALSNATSLAANISMVIRDVVTGQVTRTDVISLPPSSHVAFVMTQKYPDTLDTRGTMQFTAAYAGQVTVLGLRFNPDHAFTSVPALVAAAVPSGQGLATIGSMAHIAAGGGWKTLLTLANPGTTAAKAHLNFVGDGGKPLRVSLSLPQSPDLAAQQSSTFEQTLPPGAMLEVVADGLAGVSEQGWAQLQTDGRVTGFGTFQYQPPKGGQQEAVVPLETRGAASYILPFDNTGGYYNGVALTNLSGQQAAIAVTIRDAGTGAVLETDTISLPAQGHVSFLLNALYASATADAAVTVEFATTTPGQIAVLGLRFNSNGAFTSVPAQVKQ